MPVIFRKQSTVAIAYLHYVPGMRKERRTRQLAVYGFCAWLYPEKAALFHSGFGTPFLMRWASPLYAPSIAFLTAIADGGTVGFVGSCRMRNSNPGIDCATFFAVL